MTDEELHKLVKSIEAPDTVDSLSNGFYTLTPDELLSLINKIREEDAEICDAAFRCRPATANSVAMIYSADLAAVIRARKT